MMVPSFRYHLLTLTAIFLALGIGMIIGSSYVQSAIVDRLTRRLDDLNARFSTEVVPLRDQNQRYAKFVSALIPVIADAKIVGSRIALVQTGDYPDTLRQIRDTLTQAGVTVSSVTVLDRAFPIQLQARLDSLLAKLREKRTEAAPSGPEGVLRALAGILSRGSTDGVLQTLQEARLLQAEGDYTRPVDAVILIGGASEENESRAETVAKPLIAQFRAIGAKVIVAEPEGAAQSYIAALRESNIITIDNADTDIGRISLLLALRAQTGDYGTKKTARSGLLPLPEKAAPP